MTEEEKAISDMGYEKISRIMTVIANLDQEITMCQLWASFHQAMALTGACNNLKLFHGTNGPEFTPEEKLKTLCKHLKHIFIE